MFFICICLNWLYIAISKEVKNFTLSVTQRNINLIHYIMKLSEYEQQANDFLTSTNTILKVEFLKHDVHFIGETEKRDIYTITLQRGQRKFIFEFGQSIFNSGFYYTKGVEKTNIKRDLLEWSKTHSIAKQIQRQDPAFMNNGKSDIIHFPKEPTAYDILTSITKHDPETLQDFCDNFGYDTDSIKANKIYKAVVNEWQNVCSLYSDAEIEILQEIQ